MTSHQAAQHLGVKIEKQSDGRYADPLHISWAGQKAKFILPMQSEAANKIAKPRQMATLGALILLAGFAYQGFAAFSHYQEMKETQSNFDLSKQRVNQLQAQYDREIERKESLGFDVRLLQSSIRVFEELKSVDIDALNLLNQIARSLDADMSLDDINVKVLENA